MPLCNVSYYYTLMLPIMPLFNISYHHTHYEERAKCDIFNIDDVEFIINDLSVN